MRGDQLACQWRVIRAIKASSNGLTVAEAKVFKSLFQELGWAFLLRGAKANRSFYALLKGAVMIGEGKRVKIFNFVPF